MNRTKLKTYHEWLELGYRVGSAALGRYRLRDETSGQTVPLYSREDVVDLAAGVIVDTEPPDLDDARGPLI